MQPIVDKKNDEIIATIGERISLLRQEQGLSQAQLAGLLDVSRQAVSKWESDQSSPDTLRLIKLADVLNTEVEYLATGITPVYQSPPITVNVVEKVDRVIEKIVEKPAQIKRVVRIRYRQEPFTLILASVLFFLLGLAIGFFL